MDEFLGDFREEAAQHLQNVNQSLLALERTLSEEIITADHLMARLSLVNSLFRSFHTLKGLSGMVGLAEAERLSHLMESVLKGIQTAQIEINSDVLDLLFQGSQVLEKIIQNLTDPTIVIPDLVPLTASLSNLVPGPSPESRPAIHAGAKPPASEESPGPAPSYRPGYPDMHEASPEPQNAYSQAISLFAEHPQISAHLEPVDLYQIQTALRSGKVISLAHFTPSVEKSERGLNISSVRDKISAMGELIKAMPVVEGGNIQFILIAATAHPLYPGETPEVEVTILNPEAAPAMDESLPGAAEDSPGAPSRPKSGLPVQALNERDGSPALPTIRVEMERLENLMYLTSLLLVNKSQLNSLVGKLTPASLIPKDVLDELKLAVGTLNRHLRDLREAVTRARMVPLYEAFSHMPLAARDLARSLGKEIFLVMEGENTEIDKMLVDRLFEPLLHLVRNAITHGIETPEERQEAGKPSKGVIRLRGSFAGNQVLVQVSDDGRGIDRERVIEKSQRAEASGEGPVSDIEILDIISQPGFTTLDEAGMAAGRGMGMDVVTRMVSSVGGALEMETTPGTGTTFTLRLPITLSIVDAILVKVGKERFAVPQYMVDEVIELDPQTVTQVESGELIQFRDRFMALIRLSQLFHIAEESTDHKKRGLIVSDSEQRSVLVVDKLSGIEEVVVRSVTDPFISLPGIFGATELGDGKVILILDIPALLRLARQPKT